MENSNEKYIVLLENSDNSHCDFYITKRDNFETTPGCETFTQYGQYVGCHDAGCYSFDNSSCDCKEDCAKAIEEKFNIEIDENDLSGVGSEDEMIDAFTEPGIKDFISKWVKENIEHYECISWSFWDGSNWQSITIGEGFGEFAELDAEDAIKVLHEKPETPFIEGATKEVETESYTYHYSRYSSNPWICTVTQL